MQNHRPSIPSPNLESNLGGEAEDRFQVRDRRAGKWFWLHNDLIKRAGPHIGPTGVAVYNVLAMYANEANQTCFPSRTNIARLLGISRDKVRHAIEKLKRLHLIEVHAPEDPARTHAHNVYVLTAPELWELPKENGHAQPPAQRKSTSQKEKAATKGGLGAQPKTEASKTRLGSETQSAPSLGVSDHNAKNGDSGTVADMPKMQIGTARPDLGGVENAQGNGENEGSNFADLALNNNHQKTRLIDKTHHHDDGDAIRSLKKLGISDPRELLARALREGWTSSELVDVAERLRQVPPERVVNPAGLLVRLIREGYRDALEAVKRYAPDQHQEEQQSERAALIEAYADAIRLYQFPGLPDYEKEEVLQRGLELRARLEAFGVDPDAIKARVIGT